MTPLVEISLIPYSSFLPSPHPGQPSFPHSSPTPFSLTLSPSINPPTLPCTQGYLGLLSISNLQADSYMIFIKFQTEPPKVQMRSRRTKKMKRK